VTVLAPKQLDEAGAKSCVFIATLMNNGLVLERRFRVGAEVAAGLVVLIAVAVLGGWLFELKSFTRLHPNFAAMKPITAICFLLSAGSLWLSARSPATPRAPVASAILALLAAIAPALTLAGYLLHAPVGPPTPLSFVDQRIESFAMPAATAGVFVLFALGSPGLGDTFDGLGRIQDWCRAAGLLIALLALMVFGFDPDSLYAVGPFSTMALHTAAGFALLFLGAFSARPLKGWMRVMSAPSQAGAMARRLLLLVTLIPLGFGWLDLRLAEFGLYDAVFGIAILSVVTTALLVAVVWSAARDQEIFDAAQAESEQGRHQNEQMKAAMLDASADPIISIDHAGRIIEFNWAAERAFGYLAEEVLGKLVEEVIVPPRLRQQHRDGMARLLATGEPTIVGRRVEMPAMRADGSEFPIELAIAQTRVGENPYFTASLRDLTESKATEAQLRHSQRMDAIGQLTGGIAHDFNNLLAVIVGNLDLLDESIDPNDARKKLIEPSIRAAERGSKLTQQLLAFARRQTLMPRPIDINKLVANTADLLRRTLGGNVELSVALKDDLWRALIDPGQLENAIINLTINAADAMPEGGKLTIETANVELDEDYARHHAEVTPGRYVMIAVTDTGSGMPPEVIERAFEPFFTTKEAGRGTGLGLAMVYGFVKQSNGHIKIYSELGAGTTFKLYLPQSGDEPNAVDEEPQGSEVEESRGETILVVEDDLDVLNLAVQILESLGYRVMSATNAADAEAQINAAPELNLLFTDVMLPGGAGGMRLAEIAKEVHPAVKVLFMSGYTEQAIVHRGILPTGSQLLAKPFRKAELARAVRQSLDRENVAG